MSLHRAPLYIGWTFAVAGSLLLGVVVFAVKI